ncbi:hypothetical protein LLS47_00560 [Rouxiella badensis]|uniref:hypothetical protein n=1 Tax=Rouxiella badensis TaxID=1646377 RepID=UPI001D138167|nr:hypothetical protein [Rouxiella badensis]MCC3731424.1 hypothetical protein [Rouxiella badensis]MCC3756813.1 hypothetical protein [Rouxiella badensis]
MAPLVNLSSTHLPPSSLDPESQAKCSSPMKAKEAGIFISKEERANLDSLVEKISNDGNWQGDKSVCELLVLVVNDEDFLRALKDTVFKLKKDVNVTADETADKHSLLSALLEEPANPTPVETADFLRLIKGELATHPDKWANTLSTFTQATAKFSETMTDELPAFKMFHKKGHSPEKPTLVLDVLNRLPADLDALQKTMPPQYQYTLKKLQEVTQNLLREVQDSPQVLTRQSDVIEAHRTSQSVNQLNAIVTALVKTVDAIELAARLQDPENAAKIDKAQVATLVEGAVDLMLGEGKATASDAALDQLRREVEKTLLEKASPELKALVNTVKRQSLDNHTRSMMAVLKETAKGIKTAAKAADAYTKTMPGNLFNTEPKEIRQQFGKLAPHIFIAGHIGNAADELKAIAAELTRVATPESFLHKANTVVQTGLEKFSLKQIEKFPNYVQKKLQNVKAAAQHQIDNLQASALRGVRVLDSMVDDKRVVEQPIGRVVIPKRVATGPSNAELQGIGLIKMLRGDIAKPVVCQFKAPPVTLLADAQKFLDAVDGLQSAAETYASASKKSPHIEEPKAGPIGDIEKALEAVAKTLLEEINPSHIKRVNRAQEKSQALDAYRQAAESAHRVATQIETTLVSTLRKGLESLDLPRSQGEDKQIRQLSQVLLLASLELVDAATLLKGATKTSENGDIKTQLKTLSEVKETIEAINAKIKKAAKNHLGENIHRHSRDGRLAKGVGMWSKDQLEAFASEHPNADPAVIKMAMTKIFKDVAEKNFAKVSDPEGRFLQERVALAINDAFDGNMSLPPDQQQLLAKSDTFDRYLVKWGGKKISSRGVYAVVTAAVGLGDVTLNRMISFHPNRQLLMPRMGYIKALLAPVTIGLGVRALKNCLLPGQGSADAAIKTYLEREIPNAVARLVTGLLPAGASLALAAPLAGFGLYQKDRMQFLASAVKRFGTDSSFASVSAVAIATQNRLSAGKVPAPKAPLAATRSERIASEREALQENVLTRGKRSTGTAGGMQQDDLNVKASLDEALLDKNPLYQQNRLDSPLLWAKNHLEDKLRNAGYQRTIDWDTKVKVYSIPFSAASDRLADERHQQRPKLLETISLLDYAFKTYARKDYASLGNELKFEAEKDGMQRAVHILKNEDVQKAYIDELKRFYQRPEIKDLSEKYIVSRMRSIVNTHFDNSVGRSALSKNEVLEQISRGEVELLELDGKYVTDMACIKKPGGEVLYLSLTSGQGFEAQWSTAGLKFKDKATGDEFFKQVKKGLKRDDFMRAKDVVVDASGLLPSPKKIIPKSKMRIMIGGPAPIPVNINPPPRLTTLTSSKGYASALLNLKIHHAQQDADYLMKSDNEILGDDIVNAIGTLGTAAALFAMPFTGGASGVAVTLSGKALAFLGTASASWSLTLATGVVPKLLQAAMADRQEEARNAMIDAAVGIISEAGGQAAGELLSRSLSLLAGKMNITVDQLPAELKTRMENFIDSKIKKADSHFSDSGSTLSTSSVSSGTRSLNGSTDSGIASGSRSSGTGNSSERVSHASSSGDSGYNDFKFIDDVDDLPTTPLDISDLKTTLNTEFDAKTEVFKARFGKRENALENESNYRTLAFEARKLGYNVDVGYVHAVRENASTQPALIVKVSKPGTEDQYIYFKSRTISTTDTPGTTFGEKEAAKAFDANNFNKNYIADMEFTDNAVQIDWHKNFSMLDQTFSSTPPYAARHASSFTEISHRPDWYRAQQLDESLTHFGRRSSMPNDAVSHRSGSRRGGERKIDASALQYWDNKARMRSGVEGVIISWAANRSVNKGAAAWKSALGSTAEQPYSLAEISANVDRLGSGIRYKNTPSGTLVVGVSLNSMVQEGESTNVNIMGYRVRTIGNRTPNDKLHAYGHTQVNEAAESATFTAKHLNYTRAREKVANGTWSEADRAMNARYSAIKAKLGDTVDISTLNIPVVLVLDKLKIPGYVEGQPIPGVIPRDAIVGAISDGGDVDAVANVMEKLLNKRIPVSHAGIEETPESIAKREITTDLKQTRDISTMPQAEKWIADKIKLKGEGVTIKYPPNIIRALQNHLEPKLLPMINEARNDIKTALPARLQFFLEQFQPIKDFLNTCTQGADSLASGNVEAPTARLSKSDLIHLYTLLMAEGISTKEDAYYFLESMEKNMMQVGDRLGSRRLPQNLIDFLSTKIPDFTLFLTPLGETVGSKPGEYSVKLEDIQRLKSMLEPAVSHVAEAQSWLETHAASMGEYDQIQLPRNVIRVVQGSDVDINSILALRGVRSPTAGKLVDKELLEMLIDILENNNKSEVLKNNDDAHRLLLQIKNNIANGKAGAGTLPVKLIRYMESQNVKVSEFLVKHGDLSLAIGLAEKRGVAPALAASHMQAEHIMVNELQVQQLIDLLAQST